MQEAEDNVGDEVRPERDAVVVVLEGLDEFTESEGQEYVDDTSKCEKYHTDKLENFSKWRIAEKRDDVLRSTGEDGYRMARDRE